MCGVFQNISLLNVTILNSLFFGFFFINYLLFFLNELLRRPFLLLEMSGPVQLIFRKDLEFEFFLEQFLLIESNQLV